MNENKKIAVLMTCHNRREKTVACIGALLACEMPKRHALEIFLLDDGSTDGSAAEVATLYPDVNIIFGDGGLFWSKSMHIAQTVALTQDPNYLLWLNDDTVLLKNALVKLVETHCSIEGDTAGQSIIVGATIDEDGGEITYGGAVSLGRCRKFSYRKVWSEQTPVRCDVMNGNVVLIPRAAADTIGNIDWLYEHAMGDTDYSLRAGRKGINIYVAPGVTGFCSANPPPQVDHSSPDPILVKWREFTSRKRLPPKSWLRFTRSHGGLIWPAYFVQPYVLFILRAVWSTLNRKLRVGP